MTAKKRTAKDWAKVVQRWQRSGLAAKEFAAAEGVAATTLSWWKWHLKAKEGPAKKTVTRRRQAPKKPSPRQRKRRARSQEDAQIQLVELVARDTSCTSETPIEVALGDDVRVRVRRGFDAETLRQLLAVFGRVGTAAC